MSRSADRAHPGAASPAHVDALAAPRTLRAAVQVPLLALAELLAMALWFSASAVVPQLAAAWQLDAGLQSWLTMSVQLGFVVGALTSAVLNLPDRMPVERLMALATAVAIAANTAIAWLVPPIAGVLALRFATGLALAGVYPPGMKLVASWVLERRGAAIGLLVGALTVGSALPHLFNVLPGLGTAAQGPSWRAVMLSASASATAALLLVVAVVRPGPHLRPAARLDWRQLLLPLLDPAVRRANLGYLGHMWELYAVWAWVPLLLLQSYRAAGLGEAAGHVAGFGVIAVGGAGCVLAGLLADRFGRCRVAIASLLVSGGCALAAGALIAHPGWLTALCLLWGFAVVADSAQFSAAISELSDPRYVGTALTLQTCLGFMLTLATIRLVPLVEARWGWTPALSLLALGPAVGVIAMLRLAASPAARQLAGGRG